MSADRITTAALILMIAAGLLVVSALATRNAAPNKTAVRPIAAAASTSREALLRCQQITEPTAECSAVWAESRRHFLSRASASGQ